MLSLLRRLLGRFRREHELLTLALPRNDYAQSDRSDPPPKAPAPQAVADDESAWLFPPKDVHDPAAWDKYWYDQVTHGFGPGLFDMFCDDERLVRIMFECGLKSVLCAGCGISQEPRALAEAGFEVTALDFSPMAIQIAQMCDFGPDELAHFFDPQLRRPGGCVEFVVGDMLDPGTYPGPFDVIIERRTVQNFAPEERPGILEALAARLRPEGVFLSHCHDACWKPPAKPVHATEAWFRECGWPIWSGPPEPKPNGKVAWLFTSTG